MADQIKNKSFKTMYAISVAWQLGFLIVACLLGFLFLGTLADRYASTGFLFTAAGLVIGLAVTVYEVYHLLLPLLTDAHDSH